MKLLVYVAWLLAAASGQQWNLIWSDEFNSGRIDPTKWQHEITAWGGGNGEFQVYTNDPSNSFVRNGRLYIKPTMLPRATNPWTGQEFGDDFLYSGVLDLPGMYGYCTDSDPNNCVRYGDRANIQPTMSARLRSAGRFSFRYGRAEIRAKMPKGDWLWPAIWLLPENRAYGGWPMSGEIDIIEIIGNEDYKQNGNDIGIQRMGSALHWGIDPGQNRFYLTNDHMMNFNQNYADFFHDYVMEWDENGLSIYVDGELNMRVPNPPINQNPSWTNFYDYGRPWSGSHNPWAGASPMAPFDQPFHFIFNVAVGGTGGYIPDNCVNRGNNDLFGKPWHNSQSQIDAMWSLYGTQDRWLNTWDGDNAALQVDYIRVYERA